MKTFPAHIKYSVAEEEYLIQSVQDHCRQTANYAGSSLQSIDLYHCAYLAGLVHDCGKFTQAFHDYLWDSVYGKDVKKGSVNHTFSGCRMLLAHFHHSEKDFHDLTCELLAYAIGAHHGLFDCIDNKGTSGFSHRLEKEGINYEESKGNFLEQCADWPELEQLFSKAHRELEPIYQKIAQTADQVGDDQLMFFIGQLARLLLSAVIEGDRRDTAEFMNSIPSQISPPTSQFWEKYLSRMETKLLEFPHKKEIQIARKSISDLCRKAAEKPGGIYRLHVPTGGGKTLSSLRYALAHASKWSKQRIIFVTPLLTILEQNAQAIRDFIQDDSIILEHHSNVIEPEENSEALNPYELAMESWDSPIIITTLVQLLNTLFLGKTTSIRRYQALCNSVVIIDEVQTVPNHMLSMFNAAVNFLSSVCKTTFVLCSATQPCFQEAEHPLLNNVTDLIPYREHLWKPFRRTMIQDSGPMQLCEVPEFARQILPKVSSLLIICNKKSESEYLYQQFSEEDTNCFHLSSSMCMAHRRDILEKIKDSLANAEISRRKTLCVSTQVMEAGVDISFGCVIRISSGMDSVIQAAGRCNRNGESDDLSPVYIIQCSDENLSHLKEIQRGKQVTESLLYQFQKNPDLFDCDMASDKFISRYYQNLYREEKNIAGYQQYTVPSYGTLFQLLSWNDDFHDLMKPEQDVYTINQAFKTAGSLFHVLDDSSTDIVVPYGEGSKLINDLFSYPDYISPQKLKKWLQSAKPYTISIYDYQKKKLSGILTSVHEILVLPPEYYNIHTGLCSEPESIFLEV